MTTIPSGVYVPLIGALCFVGGSTFGQDFPTRPIRIIVANGPGSQADLAPRIIAPVMAKVLGQPITIENRPGANGIIGLEYVAKQVPADGYTITVVAVPTLASLQATSKNLRFDPRKDLPPIMTLVSTRLFLMSPAQAPWQTYNEMIVYAKANPGKANYASATVNAQLRTEGLLHPLGIKVMMVPYKSTAAYQQGMLAGEIQLGWFGYGNVLAMGDKSRVLAVTGDERLPNLKNVPTFKELGINLSGADYMLNAPAAVPKIIIDKLHNAAATALRQPDIRAQLARIELEIVDDTPDEAAKRLAAEIKFYTDTAAAIGYQPQ